MTNDRGVALARSSALVGVVAAGVLLAIVVGFGVLSGDGDSPDPADDVAPPTPDEMDRTVLAMLGDGGGGFAALTVDDDPPGGLTAPVTGRDGASRPVSQIERSWAVVVDYDEPTVAALFGAAALACGAPGPAIRVTCSPRPLEASAGQYVLVGTRLEGEPSTPEVHVTHGVAFDDDRDDDDHVTGELFDADFRAGAEHWYQLEIAPDGTRTLHAAGVYDDATDYPRPTAAAVVEYERMLVWVIPRVELPTETVGYRSLAWHRPDVTIVDPDEDDLGGDVTGRGVTEPLSRIPDVSIAFNDLSALVDARPPTGERIPSSRDAEATLLAHLTDEFFARLDAALAAGDDDAVVATVLPELLATDAADQCRAELDASLLVADGIRLDRAPSEVDTSLGFVRIIPEATIIYPTGEVAWGPFLTPGPGGRLYQLLASCA